MKKKIVWLVVSCLMVVALVLASCGPAEEEEEVTPPPTEEEEEVTPPEEEEEEVVPGPEMVRNAVGKLVEKPKYGGSLKLVQGASITNFDDGVSPYSSSGALTQRKTNDEILEGDWTLGPSGTEETDFYLTASQFFPQYQTGGLAETWEIPDKETLILHVRKGVNFHDKPPANGRELVADDIVYSITRAWIEPRKNYHQVSFPPDQRPLSVTALDKYTVEIKCSPGMVGTIMCAVCHHLSIIPQEVGAGDLNNWRDAIGTGPFILVDYIADSSASFIRNPNYWMKDPLLPENTLPYIDSFKYLIITDASTRLTALRTGKIDQMMYIAAEDAQSVLNYTSDIKWTKKLQIHPNNCIWFNTTTAPFDDIRVRRALAMAVNQQEIADTYYLGDAIIFQIPVPPFKGYEDIFVPLDELPESSQELYQYLPDKAKQLLAEAGYPNGFKTNIVCYNIHSDLLAIVKAYWSQIGVDLELDVKEYAVYISTTLGKGFTDLAAGYSVNANPFRMHNYRVASLYNYARLDDPRINEVYAKMGYSANLEEWGRNSADYKTIVPYIVEQCWSIELPTPNTYTMWWPWVKAYHGEYCVGFEDYHDWARYIWIDQDMKYEMTGTR